MFLTKFPMPPPDLAVMLCTCSIYTHSDIVKEKQLTKGEESRQEAPQNTHSPAFPDAIGSGEW
jgi:hypothetical protein